MNEEAKQEKGIGGETQIVPDPMPLESSYQIDDILLKPAGSLRTIYIPKPQFKVEALAVVLSDEHGTPITQDGKLLYEEREMKVFEKWKYEEAEMPFPELFTQGFISSNLTDRDVELVRGIIYDIAFMCNRMIKEGKDYSGFITQLISVASGIANTGKAKYGATAELSKTKITKGESKVSETIRQEMQREEERKRGILDKIRRR